MECNRACLSGTIADLGALRYSPAGIPIAEFRLTHFSNQIEGSVARKIGFDIGCIAMADAALEVSALHTGNQVKLEGFLAKKNPKNAQIVFHTNHIELIG